MKHYYISSLLVLLMLTNLHGQDYLWPVDLPRRISSNFGENRSRRFHAGIDVQTKGLKGFELKAIASGHIWRVRTSSSGYGRALYLKLDDGNIAVYAHLDRFSPILEDLISLEQERLNSYTIDKHFAPGDFVVQKGDLLGFSGESGGAFGPHLHFELRDKSNRPLNPLTNGFSLEDGRLPVPKAISITPLNKDAVINGSLLPQIFPLQRIKTREYAFMDTIHVFGEVGLGISVVDHMSRMQNKFNIYGAVLSVDDNEQYRVEFERFAFDQSKLIELERDYSLKRLNDGEFHRLFADENSHGLGFISKQSDGKLALSPGYHRVLIKLYDAQKNLVNIKGVIYQAPPIDISVSEIERTMTSVKFRIEPKGIPFPITHFTCYSFKSKGFPEKAIEATETSRDGNGMIVTLPLED
ncbi:MAG: M23 family metallopeptidase, partial [Candidatus Neomarinimicrobiota bacterium]|nr:M23 family metallopeptidase [Candidatus Neomarinimicrobiota bacterium]